MCRTYIVFVLLYRDYYRVILPLKKWSLYDCFNSNTIIKNKQHQALSHAHVHFANHNHVLI